MASLTLRRSRSQKRSLLRAFLILIGVTSSLALASCESEPSHACEPDRDVYDREIAPLVETHCGACHGEEPDNGAPFSLNTYDAIVAGGEARVVDVMGQLMAEFAMPPTGAPQPTLADRDAIAQWASCGEITVEDEGGLGSNRPVFHARGSDPEGTPSLDLTADSEPVSVDDRDRYHEVDFTGLVEEEMFITRMSPIVDESRVLHHLVLALVTDTFTYMYTWAPGTGSIDFPGGGVRLRPTDVLRLQIHYNNGSRVEDVRDSSGVRLFLGEPEGREYAMVGPGPGATGFRIDPRDTTAIEKSCTIIDDAEALAVMPHMHEIGSAFEVDLERDGSTERLIGLTGWDFETQLFYELPVSLRAGDEWTVRCHYENPGSEAVVAGPATSDEMCFAFTYVTPPPSGAFCRTGDGAPELEYAPGMCIESPLDAGTITPLLAEHRLTEEGPSFAEGELADAHYVLKSAIVASPSRIVRVAVVHAAGQLVTEGGNAEFDGAMHIVAPTPETEDGLQVDISLSGALDLSAGPREIETTCPAAGIGTGVVFGVVDEKPAARIAIDGVPDTYLWLLFDDA